MKDDKINHCRTKFPNIIKNQDTIFCDGAAGTQVPLEVMDSMVTHLHNVGSTNVGGDYHTGTLALQTVTEARSAGKDLLGTEMNGEIAFGLNCTNLMFHLARSIENTVRHQSRSRQNDTRDVEMETNGNLNIEPGGYGGPMVESET